MKWSHSKLSCILSCPMTYYLNYVMGIHQVTEKAAFAVGSAVHWGIEHDTDDLSDYYGKAANDYSYDQALSEAMAYGYKIHKDEIFKQILKDDDGELELVEELHEVWITGKLKSFKYDEPHDFVGIIDLLLLVKDKNGQLSFIVVDYKTSSRLPNWSDYLEQIYRYIFLLNSEFPDTPVKKIGIVNIIKANLRQRRSETPIQLAQRLRLEYELNDMNNINVHMFERDELSQDLIDNYITNLSRMCDTARAIDENKLFYINFGNIVGKYGKSEYYDIFMKTPCAHVLYNIDDTIWDEETDSMIHSRPCVAIDMQVIDKNNVLNKYDQFKINALACYSVNNSIDKQTVNQFLKSNFITDDSLLDTYWTTLMHDIEVTESF